MFIEQEPISQKWDYATIISVGFILEQDKSKVVLAGDVLGEDVRRVLVIPRENIISIK